MYRGIDSRPSANWDGLEKLSEALLSLRVGDYDNAAFTVPRDTQGAAKRKPATDR